MLRDVMSDEAASAIIEPIMPVPNRLNLGLIFGINSDGHGDITWSVPHDFNVIDSKVLRSARVPDNPAVTESADRS